MRRQRNEGSPADSGHSNYLDRLTYRIHWADILCLHLLIIMETNNNQAEKLCSDLCILRIAVRIST